MKKFNRILVFSTMTVGVLFLNACGVAMPAVGQNVDVPPVLEADSARYTALAEYYTTQNNRQKAIEAESARYTELARFVIASDENERQQAIETEAARYTGLASHFAAVTLTSNEPSKPRAPGTPDWLPTSPHGKNNFGTGCGAGLRTCPTLLVRPPIWQLPQG